MFGVKLRDTGLDCGAEVVEPLMVFAVEFSPLDEFPQPLDQIQIQ